MMKKLLFLLTLSLFCSLPAQRKMKDYSKIMSSKSIYEMDAFLRDAHQDDPRRAIIKPRLMETIREYIKNAHPADPRVKELQEKLAILQTKSSTKITFEEMTAKIKEKQIKLYLEELERAKKLAANPKLANEPMQVNTAKIDEEYYADNSNAKTPNSNIEKVPDTRSNVKANTIVNNSSTIIPSSSSRAYSNPEKAEFDLLMNPTAEAHKQQTVKILNALFDNDPTSKETTVMIRNTSDCDIIVRMEGTGTTKFRLAVPSKGENTIVIPKGQYLFSSLVCGAQYASQKTVQKSIMVTLGNSKK